jgi:hypothetical protein
VGCGRLAKLACLVLAVVCIELALAIPQLSAEYNGIVIIHGRYAPPGTQIGAYFADGAICGETKVRYSGQFTGLSCTGGSPGEEVGFRVNFDLAEGRANFIPGNITSVNLIVGDAGDAAVLFDQSPVPVSCSTCMVNFVLAGIAVLLIINGIYFGMRWLKSS